MSNVAELKRDPADPSMWICTYRGRKIARSRSSEYIINTIRSGLNQKAKRMKVTDVTAPQDAVMAPVTKEPKVERFSITERFDFLGDFAKMVCERKQKSLLVTGPGGLGKTHTILEAVHESNLKNEYDLPVGHHVPDKNVYTMVKGFSTAKYLYRKLFENRNRIVIFDDCDSVLRDPVALNILKAGLDSYDRRIITWGAESFGSDDLPQSFEFCGGIIFISNLDPYRLDGAVKTRAMCIDLSMTTAQKIERMTSIIKNKKFMEDFDMDIKKAALDLVDKFKDDCNDLSIRMLMQVIPVVNRGDDWKRKAEYLITHG